MHFIDTYMYVKVRYVVKILGRASSNNLFLYILTMLLVSYIICTHHTGNLNLDLDFPNISYTTQFGVLIILRLNLRINVKKVSKLTIAQCQNRLGVEKHLLLTSSSHGKQNMVL